MAVGASGRPVVLLVAGDGGISNIYPVFGYGIFPSENRIPRKWSRNIMNRF
jgi:hypothetical protein